MPFVINKLSIIAYVVLVVAIVCAVVDIGMTIIEKED